MDLNPATAKKHQESPKAVQVDRLHRKELAILGRLQAGPVDALELVRIGGIRFGARIHNLRKAGHVVRCDQNRVTGVGVYTLETT